MVDLSSCYFCGAAMDVSLREYPVVPDALAPTAQQQETVVLCGTCQRKLGRILEPVTAVATADRTNATTNPARAADVDPDGVVTPAEPDRDDDAADGTDDDPAVPTGLLDAVSDSTTDDSATADDSSTAEDTADADDADDGTPFEVDDTASVFDDDDTTTDGQDSIFADGTTSIPDAENPPRTRDGTELGDAVSFSDDTNTSERDAERTTDNASNGTNSSNGTNASNGTTNTTSTTNDDPDVDPQTYNKVVRLLKNRDLPVSRAEIEDVAGSAYAIPDHECEAIIDAAVTRGLVAERDGNLVHPDGV